MIETSNSVKSIDAKIFAIQAAAPIIRKEADNPYFKSKYAEYPEIQAAIKPLIQKEGLLVMFLPVSDNKLTMYVKDTVSNEFYKFTADLNMVQLSPQAQGSAITYLKRYMLTAFFDLQIEDAMDDDGNAGSASKKQPAAQTQKAPDNKKTLAPDNKKEWDHQVLNIQNGKYTLEQITQSYNMAEADKALLLSAGKKAKPTLKAGSKNWTDAVNYLCTENSSIDKIKWKYQISEQDLTDLQFDAIEHKKANSQTTNETK